MTYNTKLIEFIIALEFTLVIVVLLMAYMAKLYYVIRAKRRLAKTSAIEKYISNLLLAKSPLDSNYLLQNCSYIEILLDIVNKFDQLNKESYWYSIRNQFLQEVLLPLGRKRATSSHRMQRYLATKCFELAFLATDSAFLVPLINDRSPLVRLNAVAVAVKHLNVEAINVAISRIAQERRLGQPILLTIFEQAHEDIAPIVEDRLMNELNPYARNICYKILLNFSSKYDFAEVAKDCQAKTVDLQLAAIKFLAAAHPEQAVSVLIDLLQQPSWQVKAIAIQALSDLKAKEALHLIANFLHEPQWWVRVNAGYALKKFGEEGIAILQSQDQQKDKFAYETAVYVLNSA